MTAATRVQEHSAIEQCLYMAFELSRGRWLIGSTTGPGARARRTTIAAGDLAALTRELATAKSRWGLPADAPVRSCYEAGRDGFWLHRWLTTQGVVNAVVDPSSIEVPRRARRAKTDRLDVAGLLRVLIRAAGGERGAWHVVRVPTVAEEDARHVQRALDAAKRDRTRVSNRIHGVLATVGARMLLTADFALRVAAARTGDGQPIPPGLQIRVQRLWALREALTRQVAALEAARRANVATADGPAQVQLRRLLRLRAVGINAANVFVRELFGWRALRNRREVGGLFGLTPTPWRSGELVRELGIGKHGDPALRALAIEIAWGWLRFQPTSELAQWYQQRFAAGGPRMRRIGIVALARRLMIALWRYAETGEVPKGARLKPVATVA